MKPVSRLAVALATLLIVAACSGGGAPSAPLGNPTPTGSAAQTAATSPSGSVTAAACEPDKLATKYPSLVGKTLKIGTDPTSPPYESRDTTDPNKIVGFDIDLMDAVTKCIGVSYGLTSIDFGGLIPAAQAKQIDLAWSAILYKPERAQIVDFVVYVKSGDGALVAPGNPKQIKSMDDVCGLKAATVTGTVEEQAFRDQSGKCTAAGKAAVQVDTYGNGSLAAQALASGRSDIYMTDLVQSDTMAKANPDKYTRAFSVISNFMFGVAVPKGNDELRNAIYEAMQVQQSNGTETSLMSKWGIDPSLVQPTQVLTQ